MSYLAIEEKTFAFFFFFFFLVSFSNGYDVIIERFLAALFYLFSVL